MQAMNPKVVVQYQTRDGKIPFREWLLHLRDIEARARIRTRIGRLRLGHPGDCRSVGQGVFELRCQFGPGYRVYFGQQGNSLVVLLCGGDKGTQVSDMTLAHSYLEDYRRRSHETR